VKGILATLTDPAYIVSPEYQILWMNRAAEEIFGEGQRGGACHHIFYDRTEPCEVCAKNKGAARWRATLKNGKSYRFISAVIRNSKGEVEKLAVGTDITPDQEVSKIHKTFIANVSHDLRTPLAAIDQYVNILLDGLGGELNEDQANYVDVIRRSSFRLHNLIENLIDANKILSGDYKLKMEVVSIQDILDVVLGRLESQAADKGIMMQVQVADGLPAVYADKSRIAQVVANLAGNSLKFTEQGMMQIRAGFMPRGGGEPRRQQPQVHRAGHDADKGGVHASRRGKGHRIRRGHGHRGTERRPGKDLRPLLSRRERQGLRRGRRRVGAFDLARDYPGTRRDALG